MSKRVYFYLKLFPILLSYTQYVELFAHGPENYLK